MGERLLALATEHEFSLWSGAAHVLLHVRIEPRPDAEMLIEVRRRLDPLGTRGGAWRHAFSLCVLAELYAEASLPAEALGVLASIPANGREAFYAPEIHRIEGEFLLQRSTSAADDAEHCFRTALDLAGRRQEKSLELRAATSLARLWQRQGKRDDARRLLGDVYGWFTEGFSTADLRAAKALLDEMS